MPLNNHTYFSIRYGILSPKELLELLKKKGYSSFALTDINNTSACIDTLRLAGQYGIRPVLGIDYRNNIRQQYIGIAKNNEGFRELNNHLSKHLHLEKPFGNKAPSFGYAYVIYPFGSVDYTSLRENEFVGINPSALLQFSFSTWKNRQDKLVILHPSTFRNKRDFNAHRLLRAIDNNTLLSKLPITEQTVPEECFLFKNELYAMYRNYPQIIQNTEQLLDDCNVSFKFGSNKNKQCFFDSLQTDYERMREECNKGLYYRYGTPGKHIIERMEKELEIIKNFGYCSYFLINWDLVKYARHKGYYYVGRGSGANSMVAYLLRITDVDPIELDLYFERFINPYRANPPDFDIDFSWTDRDDITNYIFKTHGQENTALLGAYNTFKYQSVTRELSKVFGLPPEEINQLQRNINIDSLGHLVIKYSRLIKDIPSHLSIHASGILISDLPITSYTATYLPPKGYPTTQFSMLEAEDIGLYKFDILSQRGLGKIRDTLTLIGNNHPNVPKIDIHNVQQFKEDPKVKYLLRNGKAIGCFYVESPAMRMLLTKLQADHYLGLVAASSIIRPGVAKSGMMREYIVRFRNKTKRAQAKKELPELYALLEETYGVMVYQEDVIKVAHQFAGLTLAEADILRRGMSWKFKERNEFHKVEGKFFENCRKKGYDRKTVANIWYQIETFANFAFSKGHSASYAVESYQALYLKAHYPLEYMVATMNNFGGFYRIDLYVNEARMHGAKIELPCINRSLLLTSIDDKTIFLGFALLRSLEQNTVEDLLTERKNGGDFDSLSSFMERVPIALEQLRLLIRAGAFRFTGKSKKALLWEAHFLMGGKKKTMPKKELFNEAPKAFQLPQLFSVQHEDAFDEMELLGFPVSVSPFKMVNNLPPILLLAKDLHQYIGKEVSILGLLVHTKYTVATPKRTAKKEGQSMYFGVFIDFEGQWIDTVHFPPIAKKYPFTGPGVYLIKGKVVEEFEFVSIEVSYLKHIHYRNLIDEIGSTRMADNAVIPIGKNY